MAKQISEEQVDLIVERLLNRVQKSNTSYLKAIGKIIKKISKLTPTKAHQLIQMLKYGDNYENIIRKISKYSGLNIQDVDAIFETYAKKDQTFYEDFYRYRDIPFLKYDENNILKNQTMVLSNMVKNELYDFTRENVLGYTINGKFMNLRDTYNNILDTAFMNVGQGKETLNTAMTKIIKEIGSSGLKTINYESGRNVRLDSVVKMHLKSRLAELHNENQKIYGSEFGADGYEISVHSNPAPDHSLVQGRQFAIDQYELLQNGGYAKDYKGKQYTLDHDGKNGYRPISEMNCYHTIFPIILGVSDPEYNDKQLQEIINESQKKIEIDGKEYTKYECSQIQRQLETRIRKQKDIQMLAKESGKDELAGETQNKITMLTRKYNEVSALSGLPTKMQRMKVSGYKRNKDATKVYEDKINKMKVGEFDITKHTNKFKPTTNDVILTPKQRKHINDYDDRKEIIDLIPEIIKNPDHIYIETKKKDTIWLTKKIDEKKSHKLVIKLNTTSLYQDKTLGYKHSVMTIHPIKNKTLKNYEGKRTIKIDNEIKK